MRKNSPQQTPPLREENSRSVVRPIRFVGDDVALVAALKAGHPGANLALFERYSKHVQRVLARILGIDSELPELLHDVFIHAFESIGSIKDASRLKAWLSSLAVHTAIACIRYRKRRKWLTFSDPDDFPPPCVNAADFDGRETLRCTYLILNKLPTKLRIAFALRFIDGMEVQQIAQACGVSPSTAKRRIALAKQRFIINAGDFPLLQEWLDEADKWRRK